MLTGLFRLLLFFFLFALVRRVFRGLMSGSRSQPNRDSTGPGAHPSGPHAPSGTDGLVDEDNIEDADFEEID